VATQKELLDLTIEKVRLETQLLVKVELIETLQKRCDDQQRQIERLQDALVAREAPDAYADRKVDEAVVEESEEDLAREKRRQALALANRQVLDGMTAPTFKDADDMIAMLTGHSAPEMLRTHQNDES
jgi:hypothetical protein